MCGICGIAGKVVPATLHAMTDAIGHRGPDGRGVFLADDAPVGLGHVRLAIVDPGPSGDQPMASADQRVWLSYNGEIYNHAELRKELDGAYTFRGASDTETLLAAYLRWGRACIHRLNGMFAFALWDGRTGELWLARDRLGEKPLYYGLHNGSFRFASEIKGLLADSLWPRALNAQAADSFLRLRYVAGPETLVTGIYSLPAGNSLVWKNGAFAIEPYWAPAWQTRKRSSPGDAARRFDELFQDSVRLRLMSDVPFGVFLSGGLDSTAVAAVAAQAGAGQVNTFSIGFDGPNDESVRAAQVAAALNCRHQAIQCGVADFARLPDVISAIDQPVGDAVIVPLFLLSEHAVSRVKTVLTGEGADELLSGYAHQAQLLKLAQAEGLLALPGVAAAFNFAARVLPPAFWGLFFNYGAPLGSAGVRRLSVLVADFGSAVARYFNYISLLSSEERHALYGPLLAPFAQAIAPAGFDTRALEEAGDLRSGLMRMEFGPWLADNILAKQDTLSMANSLEARAPFLDPRLVEEVISWDSATYRRLASGKKVLRDMVSRIAPGVRPPSRKEAFRLDADGGYRAVLLRLVDEWLLSGTPAVDGLVQMSTVRRWVGELEASPFLRAKQLVAVLAFEIWLRTHRVAPA